MQGDPQAASAVSSLWIRKGTEEKINLQGWGGEGRAAAMNEGPEPRSAHPPYVVSIKFYWKTATHVHLHVVHGCFCASIMTGD